MNGYEKTLPFGPLDRFLDEVGYWTSLEYEGPDESPWNEAVHLQIARARRNGYIRLHMADDLLVEGFATHPYFVWGDEFYFDMDDLDDVEDEAHIGTPEHIVRLMEMNEFSAWDDDFYGLEFEDEDTEAA